MIGNRQLYKRAAASIGICVFIALLIPAAVPVPAQAANLVDIEISGLFYDTIPAGMPVSFDILIANDVALSGLYLGFKLFSPNGAVWTWQPECSLGSNPSFVCIVPGSRADQACIWNPYEFDAPDINEMSLDAFSFGWYTMHCGLEAGPLQRMFTAHFIGQTSSSYPGLINELCIDSAFAPPSGDFIFIDLSGNSFAPTALSGGWVKCWPLAHVNACYVEWMLSVNPTAMTVEHCATGATTLYATNNNDDPISFAVDQVIGGGGTATVSGLSNGTCRVEYTPVPEDIGKPIHLLVDVTCADTPMGVNAPWDLAVTVTYDAPALDIGAYDNFGATGNLVTKTDVTVADADVCDNPEFFIVSGPGEIDPVTGVYTWMPGESETGDFYVTIGVTDGLETDQAEIHIGIENESCCPGDANFSGDVNVGDAVFLIQFIFQGGSAPAAMNWADANADCDVNVGDVVFLINYIFRSGPAPQVGCYY